MLAVILKKLGFLRLALLIVFSLNLFNQSFCAGLHTDKRKVYIFKIL